MRIGTMSFTAIDNYGAVLQAYALAKVLEREGHKVGVIDYRIPDLKLRDWLHLMHLTYMRHAPLTVASGVPELFHRFLRIEHFRKKYLNRTHPVWTDDELHEVSSQFDLLITGSDEIFRNDREGNIFPPLFLNFADPRRQKLAAYAACSGLVNDYGDKNDVVTKLLNRFDSISVRDETTRALVKKLTGTDPRVVLDPTLLWKFEDLPLPEPPEKNYVLVYGFFRSPRTDRMVRAVADRLGASMVSVGWASKYAHHNLTAADPLQWLSCFKNARLVFTNCYHGLMFSTHYQRDFFVFESDLARIKLNDFIHRFSLASRLVPRGESPSRKQLDGMDHQALQQSIKPYVSDSIGYLAEAVQNRKNPKKADIEEVRLETRAINHPLPPGQSSDAKSQLSDVGMRMVHLIWEGVLSPLTCPPMGTQIRQHKAATVAGGLLFGAVMWLHVYSNAHLIFLPLYMVPCAWLSMKVNLRLGGIATLAAAVGGALIQHHNDMDFRSLPVMIWNITMRFVCIHVIVSLLDRLSRQQASSSGNPALHPESPMAQLTRHWAVFLTAGIILAVIILLHILASPYLMMLPFYIIPCLMIAMVAGQGWGTIMAILGAVAGPLVQMLGDVDYLPRPLIAWNMVMRFVVLQAVVLLTSFIYHKKYRPPGRAAPPSSQTASSSS